MRLVLPNASFSSVQSAALHLAMLVPDVGWGLSLTHGMLVEDAVAAGLRLEGGQAWLPQGPGIGVVPDQGRLTRYKV